MASSIQLLRSTIAQERPLSSNLLEGQPAANVNVTEPGLFFKATDGSIFKVGPTAITSDGLPPNSASVGQAGNCIGEMWLDKSLPTPVLKVYDGAQWVNAGSGSGGGGNGSFVRWIYSAIGGETSLSGSSGGVLLQYQPGLEEVFINGVLITRGVDYSASNGVSVTNLAPLVTGDIVTVVSVIPLETVQLPGLATLLRWSKLATAGQTTLSGVDSGNQPLIYTAGLEEVFINGAFLRRGVDYTASNGTSITLTAPLSVGDEITVLAFSPFTVADNVPASLVVFTQTGSTFQRTTSSKFSDIVSVKDFGAVGNGVVNDTAAIQAAVDFCASRPRGGSVHVPGGVYLVSAPIIIKTLVRLYGDGRTLSVLRLAAGSNCDVVQTENFDSLSIFRSRGLNPSPTTTPRSRGFQIDNLGIDGQRGLQTGGAGVPAAVGSGLALFGHSYILDQIAVVNCKGVGILCEYDSVLPAVSGSIIPFTEWGAGYSPTIGHMQIAFCSGGGFFFNGPIDAKIQFIYAHICGVAGVSSESNILLHEKGSGVRLQGPCDIGGIHSYGHEGVGFYSSNWVRGGRIEAEACAGGLVVLDTVGTSENSSIDSLICYKPNRRNGLGVTAVKIAGQRWKISNLLVRCDEPDLGSGPANSIKALEITGNNNLINNVLIDGFSINRVCHGLWITGNGNRIVGDVRNLAFAGAIPDVDGSFGLYFGAVKRNRVKLNIENCVRMIRMASASAFNNIIELTGLISAGQAATAGNIPAQASDSGYQVDTNKFNISIENSDGKTLSNTRRFSFQLPVHDGTSAIISEQTFVIDHGCPWVPTVNDFVVSTNFGTRFQPADIRYIAIKSITATSFTLAAKVDSAGNQIGANFVTVIVDMNSSN